MLRRLKVGLNAATKALRPMSLYSTTSSTDSDFTDRDSVHSDPSHLPASPDPDIYSPVQFGASPYEVALPTRGPLPAATYDTVEYCSRYDIYDEYGFDTFYAPTHYGTQVVLL